MFRYLLLLMLLLSPLGGEAQAYTIGKGDQDPGYQIPVIDSAAQMLERATLANPVAVTQETTNNHCLECHGVPGFGVPLKPDAFGKQQIRHLDVKVEAFKNSVHGVRRCTECHTDIQQIPHKPGVKRTVNCESCHLKQLHQLETTADASKRATLEKAVGNANNFLASTHAQPSKTDPSRPRAYCHDCHDAHAVFPLRSAQGINFRLTTPQKCGTCHEKQLMDYEDSYHASLVLQKGDRTAAVCSDCHTAHQISSPKDGKAKVAITENCGTCHAKALKTYRQTYHGQVNELGYGYTAKCYDCHDAHKLRQVKDPISPAHPDNRLATCKKCHANAPPGFTTFHAHGDMHDKEKYPLMYWVATSMLGLVFGVFAFFWTHSLLWYLREYKEVGSYRYTAENHPHHGHGHDLIQSDDPYAGKYIRRFTKGWVIAHGVLAVGVMILSLTGLAVLYSETLWAYYVMKLLGGPQNAAILHRIGAVMFAVIFFGHIGYMLYRIIFVRSYKLQWFGPYSLLPRWQDLRDVIAMFKWFFHRGPKPTFDHWTYWEKFDYWAPFWGMFIIGVSGLMMWFPNVAATYLPGWVFNIAIIVHADEAFLATVFLFSVHYFNCHYRPTRFPQDIVMFTGTIPLSEFKDERRHEYDRLVAEGKLEKYLVDPPSCRAEKNAKKLGALLIIMGIILCIFALHGFAATFGG
ncbi:cytochrome c family protein [Magnetococcus marinus MC-1]|uniref:Cytochrome c family protein n=1 Tax=Magnetococcus marinus (strain ATCC BAA-1437 / JCM 17883 / MC-1) TaxID=156889 RepID=A0L533_MAGMM|nr:cytochrome c family protein [Magnetococcus marinus]ABK43076.1 cytochrome c family protein [Magnetococcus marinus MC-1]